MPRPRSVTFLALAVLCLAAFNLLGAVSGVQQYVVLARLRLDLPPVYLIASNAVWALTFGVMAVGLWRLKRWARLGTAVIYTLYMAQGWFDRLVLSRSDYTRVTIPYAAA